MRANQISLQRHFISAQCGSVLSRLQSMHAARARIAVKTHEAGGALAFFDSTAMTPAV